ncbi:MAG: hypothetical protein ACW991_04010 [Candidatus Hodarchaeales archaeon]|jgi:hypothetical protein
MSIVKIGDKKLLEQLQARLTMRLGKRPTQQEVLDLCVKLGLSQLDLLAELVEKHPVLDEKKVLSILERRESRAKIPYDTETDSLSQDDSDIYS